VSSYGYRPAVFGRLGSRTNPARPSLVASALAGPSPLQSGRFRAGQSGAAGYPALQPQRLAPYRPPAAPQQTAAPVNPQGHPQNTAPTPGVYDINADPILQQIQALAGQSDEQANAQALKQRQTLLTGYGDPNLAKAVLGENDPTVQAAGQNPASIVAQLATQHGRNQAALEDALNKANLFYSGYRVNQESQDAQDYQGQLAGAQGQAQGGLDTIASNLAAALGQNQQQRAQAAQDAYDRQLQAALAQPPDYSGIEAPGGGYTDFTGAPNAAGYPPNTSYADLGVAPSPITSDMVAPPVMPAPLASQSYLQSLADLLYRSARGGPRAI